MLLEGQKVDLIVLDNYMPDKLGVSLLPIIREKHPEIDVIMVTAATDMPTVEACLKYGVVDYLIKPVTYDRFVQAIEKYKNRKELMQNKVELNQSTIDQFLHVETVNKTVKDLPKGIDPLTLQKVSNLLQAMVEGCTAEGLGEMLGASRTTARRYLEYLISVDKVKAELEYGAVGRPERKYYSRGS
jgi:CitB family two-component system response regulator CitT